jgi:hypothetical protein
MMNYKTLGEEVGQLVDEKNTAYGNSFNVAEDFIKLLWPNGVPPEAFNDMLCVVRIFDKLKRIATNKAYGGESPYRDIAGYALLGLMKDKVRDGSAYYDVTPTTWTPAELAEDIPVLDVELTSTPVVAHKKNKLKGKWTVEKAEPIVACYGPGVKVEDLIFDYKGIHQPVSKPKKIRKKKNKA